MVKSERAGQPGWLPQSPTAVVKAYLEHPGLEPDTGGEGAAPLICIECGKPPRRHLARGLCGPCVVRLSIEGRWEEVALPFEFDILGEEYPGRDGYTRVNTTMGAMSGHRAGMTKKLGRPLVENENVHHINGIRNDNSPDNLELWWTSQPSGQRVSDLIQYVAKYHRAEIAQLLGP